MKRTVPLLLMMISSFSVAQTKSSVRSSLYPSDWTPAFTDAQGRFLHDFSYAGYHRSEKPVPMIQGKATDITAAPYNADPSGQRDATAAIQRAMDDVGAAGGGIVYMPAGTYRLTFPVADATACIVLRHSNVVLRGAGRDKTRLFCDETVTRQKNVLLVRPGQAAWWFPKSGGTPATADLPMPTCDIPVEDVSGFAVGDLVTVKTDFTQAFIDDHRMTGKWLPTSNMRGISLLRRITRIDAAQRRLTIDTPTRYWMKTRDNLRVYKLAGAMMQESGLESFSVGMKQNPKSGLGEEEYSTEGTAAYDVHASVAVHLQHVENGWVRDVGTFCPEGNDPAVHVHSNGLRLSYCRQVTVFDCDFRHSQYKGGGGNGYLYTFSSNDCLLRDSHAEGGRHNFDFQNMWCIGNVIYHCVTKDGSLPADFHMYLSSANLLDNVTCDRDFLESRYRPYAKPVHGESGTQNVFWNTNGLRYGRKQFIVYSKQFGNGYVIGTRGPASAVYKDTDDFLEHIGQGDALSPASLWEDQLARRLKRGN